MTPTRSMIEAAAKDAYLYNREGVTAWEDIGEKHQWAWKERVRGRITAFLAQAEVEGFQMVPKEPTEAMITAGYERLCDGNLPPDPLHWEGWITPLVYAAMLSAHRATQEG